MLNRLFGKNTHSYLHVLGLSGLAFGVPLNKVLMSISMMFLVLNLLLEADFSSYWKRLKSSKLFVLILAFFFLHFVGLLWTNDFDYGFHDLRVKLPLLVIPTVIIAKPIENKSHLLIVLATFLTSVLLTSVINYLMYQHWIGNHEYNDIRGMSLFCSHVRYGIIVSMAVAISIYGAIKFKRFRVLGFIIILWLSYYTFYSQIISGLTTYIGVIVALFTYTQWNKYRWLVLGFLGSVLIGSISLVVWLYTPVKIEKVNISDLPTHTKEGNPYIHYDKLISPETGKPLYFFYCNEELERDWPKYSDIPIDGYDKKGQLIKTTLIRYLSSKDLTKDAEGLSSLTSNDIKLIEKGIGSHRNFGMIGRLYGIKYQLLNDEDPNGHSLLERMEYWKVGGQILADNWLIGVGTGDVQKAFDQKYLELNSLLQPEKRHRAHNMFLTIFITFGVFGFLLFTWMLIEYIRENFFAHNLLGLLFIVIILISFLMEDTLETQTGITFFALFFTLFSNRNVSID